MMAIAIRLLSSRVGLAVIALMVALSWHYIDKAAALRTAKQALADRVLIETLTAERDEAERRAALAEVAKENLMLAVAAAEKAAEDAERELEEYAATTTQNDAGLVNQPILDRLRNR